MKALRIILISVILALVGSYRLSATELEIDRISQLRVGMSVSKIPNSIPGIYDRVEKVDVSSELEERYEGDYVPPCYRAYLGDELVLEFYPDAEKVGCISVFSQKLTTSRGLGLFSSARDIFESGAKALCLNDGTVVVACDDVFFVGLDLTGKGSKKAEADYLGEPQKYDLSDFVSESHPQRVVIDPQLAKLVGMPPAKIIESSSDAPQMTFSQALEVNRKPDAFYAKTIKESHFFMVPDKYPIKGTDSERFSVFVIPRGTEIELLSFERWTNEFIKVRLSDGSIGFMSAIAFTDTYLKVDNDRTHIRPSNLSNATIRNGNYKVVLVESTKKVVPRQILLKGQGGKTIDITHVSSYDERYQDTHVFTSYSPLSRLFDYGNAFCDLLDSLPEPLEKRELVVCRYNPKKKGLDSFAGLSKSSIESQIGEPYAYAGPALSDVSGYTYALYKTVCWKTNKRHLDAGIIVYYDSNLRAVHLEQCPFDYFLNKGKTHFAPLVFPLFYKAQRPENLEFLTGRSGTLSAAKKSFRMPVEQIVSLPFGDRVIVCSMHFCEDSFGLRNEFAITGVLALIVLLYGLLATIWIRYIFNYGSNDWAETRTYYASLPVVIYALWYVSRFYWIGFIITGYIILLAGILPPLLLVGAITKRRCPSCHKYTNPITLSTKEGKFHGSNYQFTDRRSLIWSDSNDEGDSRNGCRTNICHYKVETVMMVDQDMKYKLQCPECDYIWTRDDKESRPSVRGPIFIEEIITQYNHRTRTVQEIQTVKDRITGEELERNVTEHDETDSWTDRSTSKRGDINTFLPYFNKYVNGDTDALNRYYRDRWDDITWGNCE